MVARQLRGVELLDPLGSEKTAANKLWVQQRARLEWADHSTETVSLQLLGSGKARDAFQVLGHRMVMNMQRANYYDLSNRIEVARTRTSFKVFMPEFYGEAMCDWAGKRVSVVLFEYVEY